MFISPTSGIRAHGGVRQRCSWSIPSKDRESPTKENPLGKREWVELIHGPQRDLKAHREAETHTWEGDCWVTRVSKVPHWIKMRKMSG